VCHKGLFCLMKTVLTVACREFGRDVGSRRASLDRPAVSDTMPGQRAQGNTSRMRDKGVGLRHLSNCTAGNCGIRITRGIDGCIAAMLPCIVCVSTL
jgi:hypothetical protein